MENISHTKWDTFIKNISFKDWDGTAINITGSVITFSVKSKIEDVTPLIQQAFVITDAVNWLARVVISNVIMSKPVGNYFFDIQWIDWTGIVRTVLKGNFLITYEITTYEITP